MPSKTFANLAACAGNRLLSLLRNRKDLALTREEFRSSNVSFSQFGEDLLILSHFPDSYRGFYVDVGAFHPFKLSNTMLLYKSGWRGVNIDVDQHKIDEFEKMRPGDKNICAAVAGSRSQMRFLRYPMSATNRLAGSAGGKPDDVMSLCGESPTSTVDVVTDTLGGILAHHGLEDRAIDYLNVDVEGMELEVLSGLDFKKGRPRLISVEIMSSGAREEIGRFLGDRGYQISSIIQHNFFFSSGLGHSGE